MAVRLTPRGIVGRISPSDDCAPRCRTEVVVHPSRPLGAARHAPPDHSMSDTPDHTSRRRFLGDALAIGASSLVPTPSLARASTPPPATTAADPNVHTDARL